MKFPLFDPRRWVASFLGVIDGWKAFWFTPADPLVLGIQRIAAGIVLLYVILVTTPLLPSLYAPDGLIDGATANRFRLESPISLPSDDWETPEDLAPPPPVEKGKAAPPTPKPPPVLRPDRMNDQAYFQRWGYDAAFLYDEGILQFSPYFHLNSLLWIRIVHGLGLVVAILFTLGLGTRVVSVLAWVYGMSLIHRAMLVTFGMDTMLTIVLFYLMLAPAGARLSLDRLIQRYRRGRFAVEHPGTAVSMEVAPSVAANVVLRLFQLHFCIIYINSGMSKLQGPAWWNGTALWQTLSNYEFTPVLTSLYTPGLHALAHTRWIWEVAMSSGDLFTLGLEIGLPFLIWFPRWRPVVFIGAVMLHTGIALTMGMTSFSMLMIIIVAAFLPADSVRRMLDRLLRGSRSFTLLVSAHERVGLRVAALVKAVDIQEQVRVVDIEEPADLDRARLVGPTGHMYHGYALFERLTRSLRMLWPIGLLTWIPGIGRLGRLVAPDERHDKHPETAGVGS